jgi:hypothetical protein
MAVSRLVEEGNLKAANPSAKVGRIVDGVFCKSPAGMRRNNVAPWFGGWNQGLPSCAASTYQTASNYRLKQLRMKTG